MWRTTSHTCRRGSDRPADLLDISHSTVQRPLAERTLMLNADQRPVFDTIKTHLQHQQKHEDGQCQCEAKPLSMFLSGVGGTGKSFLIETIEALGASMRPDKTVTCAVAAPTGLAAFSVGGIMVHSLFKLPIEHDSKTASYWSL